MKVHHRVGDRMVPRCRKGNPAARYKTTEDGDRVDCAACQLLIEKDKTMVMPLGTFSVEVFRQDGSLVRRLGLPTRDVDREVASLLRQGYRVVKYPRRIRPLAPRGAK